ncbi:hypothetical protein ACTFIZ_009500 [Dictyostelium cf. discoideum]
MKIIIFFILLLFNLIKSQQYGPTWDQINSRPLPGWYDDVKFGIFIHFGVYSVPAYANGGYAEWYWWTLKNPNSDGGATLRYHEKEFGANFTYQDFVSQFNCRLFNADEWASIIEKSGAKYVVLTSKHHEGYTLWNSEQSWNWNSVETGPGIDIVGELTKSVKNMGLHMGLYHSLFEWFNPLYLADAETGKNPTTQVYVDEILMKQLKDIVTTYEPELIWADGDWMQLSEYWKSTEFLSWLYTNSSVKDTVIVNDRWGSECRDKNGGYYTGADHFNPYKIQAHKWENCATIGYSYGYDEYEQATDYQNATELIIDFVTTVACGGNFLLDIGPDAQGTIPNNMVDRLLEIGNWLSINSESIYGSSPWRVQNETFNIWYTTNTTNGNVYAFVFELPDNGILNLSDPIGSHKTKATLLGLKGEKGVDVSLPIESKKPGLTLKIPMVAPQDYPPYVYVFRLTNVK